MLAAAKPSATRSPHRGDAYDNVMADLSAKRGTGRYLEIGVNAGLLFTRITADEAIGVDPAFCLKTNVAANKKTVSLHQITSDGFFASYEGDAFDLVFLDGFHTFEFALRDFFNAEEKCHRASLIVLHDCFPLNEAMADRTMTTAIQRGQGTPYAGMWTGDVWKIVLILQRFRPDLRLVCVDAPPTGLLCVTNLDPTSRVLKRSYLEIVDTFAGMPNTMASIEAMYAGVEMVDSRRITNGFDQSCFFVT